MTLYQWLSDYETQPEQGFGVGIFTIFQRALDCEVKEAHQKLALTAYILSQNRIMGYLIF